VVREVIPPEMVVLVAVLDMEVQPPETEILHLLHQVKVITVELA
jgi:hypothetical protein